jgi:hypothetical protein
MAALLARRYAAKFADPVERRGRGFNSYEQSIRFQSGAFLCYSHHRDDLFFSLPQSAFDRLEFKRQVGLLYFVKALFRANITRLDVYYDDYSEGVNTQVIQRAYDSASYPSKSRNYTVITERSGARVQSETVYMGSRKSEFFARCYDKRAEAGTGEPRFRLEFQMRNEVAAAFLEEMLYRRVESMAEKSIELLLSRFDFTERSGSGRRQADKRLGWWEAFVGLARKAAFAVAKKDVSLLGTLRWAENCWSVPLAKLRQVMGNDRVAEWLGDLLRSGDVKLNLRRLGANSAV